MIASDTNKSVDRVPYLFIILIWLAFLLPVAEWSAFPFITGHTNLSELAIIAMPFVYALYPRRDAIEPNSKYVFLKKIILIFFGLVFLVNIMQFLVYGGAIADYFRRNRLLIPLYVALALIYLGPRIRPERLFANLLLCLSISFLISTVYFFLEWEFVPFFKAELDEESFSKVMEGRAGNVNGGFSLIALGLTFGIVTNWKSLRPYWLRNIGLLNCIFSFVLLILSFNRTLIGTSILFLAFLNLRRLNLRLFITTLAIIILGSYATYYAYQSSENVQRQVEQRIITALQGQDELLTSVYYGNRDFLYEDYLWAAQNYYFLGVPPTIPITLKYVKGEFVEVNFSDISLVTVFLRLGSISMFVYLFIFLLLYKYLLSMNYAYSTPWSCLARSALLYSLPFMALASFNIDLLARHYAILFIALIFLGIRKDFSHTPDTYDGAPIAYRGIL